MTDTEKLAELGLVLDGYNAALELKQKEEQELDRFTSDFTKIAKTIIEPTMNEIRDLVKRKGHNSSVTFEPKGAKTIDGKSLPSIDFTITPPRRPKHWKSSGDPRLSFYAVATKTVAITKYTVSILDTDSKTTYFDYPLSKITSDLVKTKIIELFKESYGETWEDYF